jgi:CRP-like cAMP-binding protein
LAALPVAEYERLRPYLETVPLALRDILYGADQAIPHVYFPLTGVLSLISRAEDQIEGVEVGVVGREGAAGLPVFLGGATATARCVVQIPGQALRMRSEVFRTNVGRDSALHGLLLRYTHAFLTQVAQSVVCTTRHPVEQRLARWVLAIRARAGMNQFPLTHEFLAAMLGVRRATISVAARAFQKAGLIRYGRGQMTVLQPRGLERAACECHRIVQAELDWLPA